MTVLITLPSVRTMWWKLSKPEENPIKKRKKKNLWVLLVSEEQMEKERGVELG